MAYRLAPNIHVAEVDGDLVILDAINDDYICISVGARRRAGIVSMLADDLPEELVQALLAEGLLVSAARSDWPDPLARTATADLLPHVPASPRVRDLAHLAIATLRTWLWLRRRSPADWFTQLRARPPASEPHPLAIREAARRFRQLRPLVPRSGRCLIQSMLLLHFLRLQGLTASWVFGVRTYPFEAHCWLECNGVVLDDTVEHVGWFTPIARVP
jgi:transglutaminase-like putative cysteine protease